MPNSQEIEIVAFRVILVTFSGYCNNTVCNWILVIIFFLSSIILCTQYYKGIPYYNPFLSVFWGTVVFVYMWFSLNAVLMMFIHLTGQVIVIIIGIPLLAVMVKYVRDKRIENLLSINIDKLKRDTDALL